MENLTEALESSMVNKDSRYNLLPSKKNFEMLENASPVFLMELAINKRVRNDFKDSVRTFMNELVKPCYQLKMIPEKDRNQMMVKHMEMINFMLHKRRDAEDSHTAEANQLSHGLMLPFLNEKNSNLVVRVHKDEIRVFETRERAPYLFVIETIE